MKKSFTLLFAGLLSLCVLATQAQTIRRVNNTGVAVTGVNVYTTLQAAHDAASSGDIICLEPSNISYGALVCVRPLTIIGNGYFLSQNTGLQLDVRESLTDAITFAAGSAGSRITGCDIGSTLYIGASNVTVERNNISNAIYIGYNNSIGYVTVSGIIFRQNYATGTLYIYPGSNTTVSNVNITNNIFNTGGIGSSGQYTRMTNILISNNVVGSITNPTGLYGGIDVDNAVIKNNILAYTGTGVAFTPRNNAYSYNISGNMAFGTANGNQQNITPANLFVGGTASTDGAYQLRTASPAIGTGESGTDVGAFGGVLPYRLSGIPNVPTIYQYNQSVSGNSLNATISTRSNN